MTFAATSLPRDAKALRVALVCMPFNLAIRPSIQIGLLQAIAQQAGFAADAHYLNLDLAQRMGPEFYEALAHYHRNLLCDWLFSIAAFGEAATPPDEAYWDAFPGVLTWAAEGGVDGAMLSQIRHRLVPAYIQHCLDMVDWGSYDVVGFSSTFQQNVACLALARRIKETYPEVRILFGGSNLEGEMGPELVRSFPFIDYAVVGEGDIAFPALLERLSQGRSPADIPGVVSHEAGPLVFAGQAPPCHDLDALPTPNYDAFFEHLVDLDLMERSRHVSALPFEASRGCWWGQKHHCAFCGFQREGLVFRAKSPARVMRELGELSRKYRETSFEATDFILGHDYIDTLFRQLQEHKLDYRFFWECKANLNRRQLQQVYQGGIRWIQPGIESLSTHVLGLMNKGCTMLQNVRFLKWAYYYSMRVAWNMLWGFPGETVEDYTQMLETMAMITHLEPPGSLGALWLERFSPYYENAEAQGIRNLGPQACYRYVYPSHVNLDKLAFLFDYEAQDVVAAEEMVAVEEFIRQWKENWHSPQRDTLTYRRTRDAVYIDDNRRAWPPGSHAFYGPLAAMYEYCSETMVTAEQVSRHLSARDEESLNAEQVEAALAEFCARGLMLTENGRYLSLALPTNPNW